MNTTDILCIVVLALFSLFCFVVAFIFSAWWLLVTDSMCILLAGAIYSEEKK